MNTFLPSMEEILDELRDRGIEIYIEDANFVVLRIDGQTVMDDYNVNMNSIRLDREGG